MAATTENTARGALEKNDRYDRQLRLWGDHGQTSLERARVCLINATPTGTEILKNLILPGVGAFTIVDGKKVSGEDAGSSFFLTSESIGKSRAKEATEALKELNETVVGDFIEESVESLLERNPSFFSSFTVVIATQLCEKTLQKLGSILWQMNIPLLVCRCYGFFGILRLVVKEHTVVESHPDSSLEDLRLDRPFPALEEYCNSMNLSAMTKTEHSHTPWLVILYKYLMEWKEMHDGQLPGNYQEKRQLKELISKGQYFNEEGIMEEEENFGEAIRSLNTALTPTNVPADLMELFNDPCCQNLTSESSAFWIILRAVRDFVNAEGQGALPLRGTLPDMTSDSERYIALQQIYRQQAERDLQAVSQRVHSLLQQLSRSCDHINETDIRTFCRNAAFLRLVRCRSLEAEYNSSTADVDLIGYRLLDEDSEEMFFYVLLRAVDRYYEEHNCFPGQYQSDQWESDVVKLKGFVTRLLAEWKLSGTVKDDYITEMCRYGAAELIVIAAYMGGVAAQEVIKLITHQYVPINNTYIYNAMKATSVTFQL